MQIPTSYAPEVIADSSGQWSRNGLRFATEEEARACAYNLLQRWTLVTDYRAEPTSEPVTHRWDARHGLLEAVQS